MQENRKPQRMIDQCWKLRDLGFCLEPQSAGGIWQRAQPAQHVLQKSISDSPVAAVY